VTVWNQEKEKRLTEFIWNRDGSRDGGGNRGRDGFSFIRTVFSVRRTGNSVFLWEGGITVFNGITGTDRLSDKGPGQDDEGWGGTQCWGWSRGGWYNPAGCLTARLLKIWVRTSVSLLFFCRYRDTLWCIGIRDGKVLIAISSLVMHSVRA
jgi:hypothetical protein